MQLTGLEIELDATIFVTPPIYIFIPQSFFFHYAVQGPAVPHGIGLMSKGVGGGGKKSML